MKRNEAAKGTPVTLQSAGPIDDCGRRWNMIYWICAAVGGVLGFFNNGIGPLFGCALLGLLVGWIIKNAVCNMKIQDFRMLRFSASRRVPYPELTTKLIGVLTPLGMSVENDKDGTISISYRGRIYDVSYEDDASFRVWWRIGLGRAILGIGTIDQISAYRKTSQAIGIIAWNIQQICNADEAADPGDPAAAAYAGGNQNYGVQNRPKKNLVKPLLVVAAAVLVLIVGSRLRKDDSLGISGMTFGEMTHSLGEAVEQEPFCDAEWSNDDESAVLLTFNDQAANAYEIYFSLFDSGTQARIDAAYINGIVFDDVELTYLLEYLDTGDFEEFETDLSSYALVSAILY